MKDPRTELAVERTRLAHERTLMAWVRTAISLISFGFTIYKFFQIEEAGKEQGLFNSASALAVLMIIIALVSLLMAVLDHRRDMGALRAQYPDMPPSRARVLAALISVLGVVALIAVILRQ